MISPKVKNNLLGVLLMASASLMIAGGQFFWKLASGQLNLNIILGFIIYGLGAVLMIHSLKFGELSVLHPVMAVSYITSTTLAIIFLDEAFTFLQFVGIIFIILGVILLGVTQHK